MRRNPTPSRARRFLPVLLLASPLALSSCDLVDALAGSCHIQEATNLLSDYHRGCLATLMDLDDGVITVSIISSEFDTSAPDLNFTISGPLFVGRRGSSGLTAGDLFDSVGSGYVDWVITGADGDRFGERMSVQVIRGQLDVGDYRSYIRLDFRDNLR